MYLCHLLTRRNQSQFAYKFPFLHLIHTSSQTTKSINDEATMKSVIDSLHKRLSWKTLKEKFVSVKFTSPVVQSILLELKEPINSRKALNFFHWSAKEMHFQHGISSYCITIHILVKARLVKDANALLESVLTNEDLSVGNGQALIVLRSLIESYEFCDSVPFVFDVFIQTCAKLRIVVDALDACKLVYDNGFSLNLTSFNILLHVIQKSEMTHLVWGVYEHIIDIKVHPNNTTMKTMISALCKEGKLEEFVDIVEKMHGKRCSIPRIIVNTCLVYEMIDEDRIEDALVILTWMLQKNMIIDTVSYCLVVFAKVKKDNLNVAKEIYDEMLKRGFEQNVFVCSLFIGEYSKQGRMDEAISLFEEMESFVLRPMKESFNRLIEGCSINGLLENSLKYCNQMTSLGILPSCSTVHTMFKNLCENGSSRKADEMLTVLLDKGFTPDENLYSCLIEGYCREGNVEGAMKLLFEMEYRSISPNVFAFSSLIIILCKSGRLSEAKKYFEKMKAQSLVPSPNVRESLVAAYLQKGDGESAYRLQC